MEWGVLTQQGAEMVVPQQSEVAKVIEKPPLPRELHRLGLRKRDQQLSNGGRLYVDHGHPESSITEVDTLDDVPAAEIADEEMILAYFVRARREGIIGNFILNKCVRGDHSSWGYHENYLVEREVLDVGAARKALLTRFPDSEDARSIYNREHAKKLELVGLHLATRNIFAGAGTLLSVGKLDREVRFVIGQKTSDLTQDYAESTVFDKPVVNLRDNPYADPKKWARLHVTSVDPTMSPWATKMKIGTTSLVLDVLRYGIPLECGTVAEPDRRRSIFLEKRDLVGLARHTGEDVTCKRAFRFKDGNERTPLQIQYALLEAAKQVAVFKELTDDDQWVLEQWQQALDDISEDPMKLEDRSDWVRRYKLLSTYEARATERKKPRFEIVKRLRKLNQAFDRIWEDPSTLGHEDYQMWRVSAMAARLSIWKKWMPPRELIDERRVRAPRHLRGHARGHLVARFHDRPSGIQSNYVQTWAKFVLRDRKNREVEILMPDPFDPNPRRQSLG